MVKTVKGFVIGVVLFVVIAITYGWRGMLMDKDWADRYRDVVNRRKQ